jgi:hypothetical protein
MRFVLAILFFSLMLTTALLFLGMTAAAIKYRKFRYEPSSPPIVFSARPVRFVLSCIAFAVFGGCALFCAIFGALYLYRML